MITVETKLIGLLGKPLKHSFSPKMHNKAFDSAGLNYYYFSIEVGKENLPKVLEGIRHMNFAGFNVTRPNKVRVIEHLDDVEDLAEKIGAVNTVVCIDDKLIGYNTDGRGFIESLKNEISSKLAGKKYMIIGAGGAGRTIAFHLADEGAEKVSLFDQHLYCSRKVANNLNKKVCNCAEYYQWNKKNLQQEINECEIIINATGVGMYPDIDSTPLDKSFFQEDLIACDITYNPLNTRFLKEAKEAGCETINGIGMLINQGAKAFELWTETEAPKGIMEDTVKKIIKKRKRND